MADKEKAPATKPRGRTNGVAIDDKDRSKRVASGAVMPEPEAVGQSKGAERKAEDPGVTERKVGTDKKPKAPSVEAGDMPEAVRKRYYADKAKWSGDPAYFTSAETKDPAFRDQGRRLVTATESQEVVKDLVAIAQHRSWDRIHVTGTEAFRRSVWLEAGQKGLEVRGYKPNDRDLQELDRLRSDASKNTIAPMVARDATESRHPASARRSEESPAPARQPGERVDGRSLPNDRAVDSQMRVMEAVIRRTLFDNPEAVTRVMTVARAQLDAHVAAGRTIQPAVVRDTGASVQRGPERGPGVERVLQARQGRDHKPPERNRSR